MTQYPVTVEPEVSVVDARAIMHQLDCRHLPVTCQGALVGIVSDRDLWRPGARIGEIMTPDPTTLDPDDPLELAAATMVCLKISALPVLCDGCVVGIVTSHDLLRTLVSTVREECAPDG